MPIHFRSLTTAALAAALFWTAAGPASAQALSRDGDTSGWRHSVTPYMFLPFATTGSATIDGRSAEIDMDLGDVFDILQGAASVRYEGWNGRFGIISEVYYVRLEDDAALPIQGVSASVDARQTYVSLMGAYRFADGVTASGRRWAADAGLGLRWNRLTQEVTIAGPNRSRTFGGTEEWFEPAIGLRYAVELNDRWAFGARVELSGFGVEGDDLQYVALAGFDWRAWENTSLRFGYQFYGIDYATNRSGGRFAYDVDQHGLYAAVAFHF